MVCKNNWKDTGPNEAEIDLYPIGKIQVYELSFGYYAANVLNERINIKGGFAYAQSEAVAFAEELLGDAMRQLEEV
jgi:hypothetical protein